jgi:hypothetical protein
MVRHLTARGLKLTKGDPIGQVQEPAKNRYSGLPSLRLGFDFKAIFKQCLEADTDRMPDGSGTPASNCTKRTAITGICARDDPREPKE